MLGAIFGLLLLDAAWIAINVKSDLQTARSALTTGGDALIGGSVDAAEPAFRQAAETTSHADGLLRHPAALLARYLPFVGDDVRAVQGLTEAASTAAGVGTELTAAARSVGWAGGSLTGLSSGSSSLANTLSKAGGQIRSAADRLRTAATVLSTTSTGGLIGPIREAVIEASSEIGGRAALLDSAKNLAEVVPSLFQDGRRYLLVVQNPDEPRGTGGFMGYFGFLRSVDGSLQLERFFPAEGELADRPVDAPADYRARYARFDALIDIRQSNFTPDLPTAANVTLQLARRLGWGEFDGIMLVDPVWMQYMLEAIGPVETPAWDVPIDVDNVLSVLCHDVFLLDERAPAVHAEESRSNIAQGRIGTAIWNAIQTRDVAGTALATALARASAERHLQVYSSDPQEEQLLSNLGVGGETVLGRNPLFVSWIGLSANKAAYFAQRSVDVDVDVAQDGTATVTTTLHLHNTAPDDPPGGLLGDGSDFPVGTWASEVSVYMPERIEGIPTYEASGPTVTGQEEEFGRPVSLGFVWAPAGRSYTWSVTYVAPEAVTTVADESEYRLDFLPQPMLSPLPLRIHVQLPPGATATSGSAGVQIDGGSASFEGQPATAQSIWVRFS